jgi:hypothetical protein
MFLGPTHVTAMGRRIRHGKDAMACCEHCTDAESVLFTEGAARRELRGYRRRGPAAVTRQLLAALREQGAPEGVLLDIGGGIGALQHELLGTGMARAIHVDASRAYLDASAAEAERRGHRDRVEYRHGDFVDLADSVPDADVVTLDRVVCCYPDMPALVRASAPKARHSRRRRSGRAAGSSSPLRTKSTSASNSSCVSRTGSRSSGSSRSSTGCERTHGSLEIRRQPAVL